MGLSEKVLDLGSCFRGGRQVAESARGSMGMDRGLSVLGRGLCFRSEAADFLFICLSKSPAGVNSVTTIVENADERCAWC